MAYIFWDPFKVIHPKNMSSVVPFYLSFFKSWIWEVEIVTTHHASWMGQLRWWVEVSGCSALRWVEHKCIFKPSTLMNYFQAWVEISISRGECFEETYFLSLSHSYPPALMSPLSSLPASTPTTPHLLPSGIRSNFVPSRFWYLVSSYSYVQFPGLRMHVQGAERGMVTTMITLS